MIIVGVTGGIASGKSTVTKMLAELGAQFRSADDDARAVLQDDPAVLASVRAAFPEARASNGGGIDRAALAARIFSDPAARVHLEQLLHPAIIARMRDAIAAARATDASPVLVYEVPLLYEANLESLFDTVVAVLASPDLQAERLQAREAAAGRPILTPEAIAERFAAQLPPEEKARRADFVVRTDVSLEETRAQARDLWTRWTSAQGSSPATTAQP